MTWSLDRLLSAFLLATASQVVADIFSLVASLMAFSLAGCLVIACRLLVRFVALLSL